MSAVVEELVEPGESPEAAPDPAGPLHDPAPERRLRGSLERLRGFALRRPDACIVAALVVIVVTVQGMNIANFPTVSDDEGTYLASISTMYRLLHAQGEVGERRRQATHPATVKPELVADAPNRVWSWDITKLAGPARWTYYYPYTILDIFSRYAVGWMVAHHESAALAERLIAETLAKQGIGRDQLAIHADRGSSMASKLVAQLLADLGVTKSHSRPHVSNDNPYSEAQFKTLKYRPAFPDHFGSIQDARVFCQDFFAWYNLEHHHSGIGLLTPADVHYGRAEQVQAARAEVLTAAYAAHPERFVRKLPQPPRLPTTAWINKPDTEQTAQ